MKRRYYLGLDQGTIVGITADVTAAHIALATLEATAYQVRDIFDILQKSPGFPSVRCGWTAAARPAAS